MKRAIVLCVLAVVGCKKHAATAEQADQPVHAEPSTKTATPNSALPTTTTSVDTASGSKVSVKLKPLDEAEAQDLETLKRRTHAAVTEWLSEETLPDGWAATYSGPRIENVQDDEGRVERKQTGLTYGVYVHRTIDGNVYKCVAKLDKREDVAPALAACKTATP